MCGSSKINLIERKSKTSRYHGGKISESQQSFLSETVICIVERWKRSMDYRFVLECNLIMHRKVIHVNFFRFFFLPHLQYHGLLRSRNFATMATWRNDFISLLAYKSQGVVVRVPRKYWPEAGIFDVRKYLAAILCSFFTNSNLSLYLYRLPYIFARLCDYSIGAVT